MTSKYPKGLALLGEVLAVTRETVDWCRAVGSSTGDHEDYLELVRFVMETQMEDPDERWDGELEEALCAAIEEDWPDVVRKILDEHGDVLNDGGRASVMQQACIKTAPSSLAAVLDKWPRLAVQDRLREVIRCAFTPETAGECAAILFRHGVRHDTPGEDGLTPMRYAEKLADEDVFAAIERAVLAHGTPDAKPGVRLPRKRP